MRLLLDLVQHATPVVEFYFFGGVLERYALLTAFDLALGVIVIVALTRSASDAAIVDPRSRSLPAQAASVAILTLLFGGVALIVAVPIGMPAFIWSLSHGLDWKELLVSPGLWTQLAVMSGSVALRAYLAFTATTAVKGELPVEDAATRSAAIEESGERSRAANAAQVTLIATFVGLCYVLMSLPGDRVLNLLPAVYSGMLAFYDARPDIGERIFPELWRRPQRTPATARPTRGSSRRRKR